MNGVCFQYIQVFFGTISVGWSGHNQPDPQPQLQLVSRWCPSTRLRWSRSWPSAPKGPKRRRRRWPRSRWDVERMGEFIGDFHGDVERNGEIISESKLGYQCDNERYQERLCLIGLNPYWGYGNLDTPNPLFSTPIYEHVGCFTGKWHFKCGMDGERNTVEQFWWRNIVIFN